MRVKKDFILGIAESNEITETSETSETAAETVTENYKLSETLPDVILTDILAEDFIALTTNSETTPSPLHSFLEVRNIFKLGF